MTYLAGEEQRLERLGLARALLDAERVALDKTPITGDEHSVNTTAELVTTIRDLIDEVGEALAPHVHALPAHRQRTLTNGWTLYDEDRAATHPRLGARIMVRQHVADGEQAGRYLEQRRGLYEHGHLKWRLLGSIDGNVPVPPGYAYTWRHQQ